MPQENKEEILQVAIRFHCVIQIKEIEIIMGLYKRQWIILLTFYTVYLMFGACIFHHIEHQAETVRRTKELEDRMSINGMLSNFIGTVNCFDYLYRY